VRLAAQGHEAFITGETLALEYQVGHEGEGDGFEHLREVDLDGVPAQIALSRIKG
jgi:hypothetical protein